LLAGLLHPMLYVRQITSGTRWHQVHTQQHGQVGQTKQPWRSVHQEKQVALQTGSIHKIRQQYPLLPLAIMQLAGASVLLDVADSTLASIAFHSSANAYKSINPLQPPVGIQQQ
jgi:hypothetical protein